MFRCGASSREPCGKIISPPDVAVVFVAVLNAIIKHYARLGETSKKEITCFLDGWTHKEVDISLTNSDGNSARTTSVSRV